MNRADQFVKHVMHEPGRPIKATFYRADGTVNGYSLYEYDSVGNKTKETAYKADGTVSGYCIKEYTALSDLPAATE